MDRNVSRRRPDRAQLSLVLDAGLVAAVRARARCEGVSIVSLVERALEVSVDGYVVSGPGDRGGVASGGGGVGEVDQRGGVSSAVAASVGRVDWDVLLAQGRAGRVSVTAVPVVVDPIEEIA